ncbi:MAG: type I-U CRISPR-associated protein Cas5/Cas6 [Deltaproteobacteria bacterium]|nr:type I-U CRISPR-associated protein Cas5/Cas6 [Deltaproteobacteria bacterium]
MVVIKIKFLAGKYHATPWGKHVNEGTVEWPVSMFRLARAVIASAKRNFPSVTPSVLEELVEIFTADCNYELVPAGFSHTRAYLSENKKAITAKQKIFDSFVAMPTGSSIFLNFDTVLNEEKRNLLTEILEFISYLGRSESWVEISLMDENFISSEMDSFPYDGLLPKGFELVELAFPSTKTDFSDNIKDSLKIRDPLTRKMKSITWFDALCMGSSDVQKYGLSSHPCIDFRLYARPVLSSSVFHEISQVTIDINSRIIKFALSSRVLPPITDAIKISEAIRKKLMGISRRLNGGSPSDVSPSFSGKSNDGVPVVGHDHAYILPVDENHDGFIDNIYIIKKDNFSQSDLKSLDKISGIWSTRGRPEIDLIPVKFYTDSLPFKSRIFVSHTPFVTRRHWRKGRGIKDEWLKDELLKEFKNHSLPSPINIEIIRNTKTAHEYSWRDFYRKRLKSSHQLEGYGFRIIFENDISGPFAVGALAHYGLGTFWPEDM